MSEAIFSKKRLNRALLARQLLLERSTLSPLQAVDRIGPLQAQWPKPPFVALWSRLESFQRTDLTKLALARSVVRSTLHRGTLHLTTASNFLEFRPALQPTLTRGLRAIVKEASGIDEDAVLATARAFFEAGACTFTALRAHLLEKHPTFPERNMGYLVRMVLPLVQVPDASPWGWPSDAAFALADTWLKISANSANTSPTLTLRHLILRYLRAFGPASVRDIQSFTGVPNLAKPVAALIPELLVLRAEDGTHLYDLPEAPRPDADIPAPPRLLAEYDSVILAHHDRTRIVATEHRPRVALPGLRIPATFLVDGVVAGTWSVTAAAKGKSPSAITLDPFGKLSKRTRDALEIEGEAVLAFLSAPAR